MSREYLADDTTHTEAVKAFSSDEKAQNYANFLATMEWDNDEEFYIEEVEHES
jgi:hypothetical protein